MGFYLKRVVTKDTPADVAWRKAYADVVSVVDAQASAKFPVVDNSNVMDYVSFKQNLLDKLVKQIVIKA